MPSRALTRIGTSAALVLYAALPALAQDRTITGARASIIEKPAGALSITLQNLRDSPLVAWELAIAAQGAAAPAVAMATDFTRPFAYRPANGPLNPGDQREVKFLATHLTADSPVVVQLAVFADGYYEGQRKAVEMFSRRRAWHADDVQFWLAALGKAPRTDDESLRGFLRDQLARHAARPDARQSSEAARLRSLAFDDSPRPPGWMAAMLERQLEDMREYYTRLQQPLKAGPESLKGRVDSVGLATADSPAGRFYILVENLTDVPIEAFGLLFKSGTAVRWDLCCGGGPPARDGPIRPGGSREFPASVGHGDNPEPPDVTLSFVLFANLRVEGLREQCDALMQARDRRADNIAFSMAALSEAVQQPADKIVEFLESKKRERAIALGASRDGPPLTDAIDQVIMRAKSAPGEVLTLAADIIARLKQERALLTRHHAH